jgi:hypothetical protein
LVLAAARGYRPGSHCYRQDCLAVMCGGCPGIEDRLAMSDANDNAALRRSQKLWLLYGLLLPCLPACLQKEAADAKAKKEADAKAKKEVREGGLLCHCLCSKSKPG